jgi:GNAT superfamily N-acetyltransferase
MRGVASTVSSPPPPSPASSPGLPAQPFATEATPPPGWAGRPARRVERPDTARPALRRPSHSRVPRHDLAGHQILPLLHGRAQHRRDGNAPQHACYQGRWPRGSDGTGWMCRRPCLLSHDGAATAEASVVVADSWQRRGLGSALLRWIAADSAARGIRTLVGEALPNHRIEACMRKLFPTTVRFQDGWLRLESAIASAPTEGSPDARGRAA